MLLVTDLLTDIRDLLAAIFAAEAEEDMDFDLRATVDRLATALERSGRPAPKPMLSSMEFRSERAVWGLNLIDEDGALHGSEELGLSEDETRKAAAELLGPEVKSLLLGDLIALETLARRDGDKAALELLDRQFLPSIWASIHQLREVCDVFDGEPEFPDWVGEDEQDRADYLDMSRPLCLDPVPRPTAMRDAAGLVAERDWQLARQIAREINDPWFRCQGLANAAEQADQDEWRVVVEEAFAAAKEHWEINRRVSVSSWPLGVLLRRGDGDEAKRIAGELVELIAKEPSPVRRADALEHLLDQAEPGRDRDFFGLILDPLVEAALTPLLSGQRNKRGESLLVHLMPGIFAFDQKEAQRLAGRITGEATRVRALQVLAELRGPRR